MGGSPGHAEPDVSVAVEPENEGVHPLLLSALRAARRECECSRQCTVEYELRMHLDRSDPMDRQRDRDETEPEHRLGPGRIDEAVPGARREHRPERPVAATDVKAQSDPGLPVWIPLV